MKGSAIVVGGGPAGYSAALRLRRGGMDVPLTGLTAEDCADTICRAFSAAEGK